MTDRGIYFTFSITLINYFVIWQYYCFIIIGLSARVIRVWFQNKRCKDKKRQQALRHLQQRAETASHFDNFFWFLQSFFLSLQLFWCKPVFLVIFYLFIVFIFIAKKALDPSGTARRSLHFFQIILLRK